MFLKNKKLSLHLTKQGVVDELQIRNDPNQMNWLITESYLDEVNFNGKDKLFGNFEIKIEDKFYRSIHSQPRIQLEEKTIVLHYNFNLIDVMIHYDMATEDALILKIVVNNKMQTPLKIQEFSIWTSFSYSMFRNHDIKKNIFHSTAFFPSVSPNYSKFALMRRSTTEKSLGMFQLKGETLSVGSYCEFQNKFFEDVSPSLDGVVYHQLILSAKAKSATTNWVYPMKQVTIPAKESVEWEYALIPINDQADFYKVAKQLGHPTYHYPDMIIKDHLFQLEYLDKKEIEEVTAQFLEKGVCREVELQQVENRKYQAVFSHTGEHRLNIHFSDGTVDSLVINVMCEIKQLISDRVDYLCEASYREQVGDWQHVFTPVSNQGESLGKMALVLKKNILDHKLDPR